MNKLKSVIKFEVVRQIKKPAFWIALIMMPILIFGISLINVLNGTNANELAESGADITGKTLGITDASDLTKDLIKDNKLELGDIIFNLIKDPAEGIAAVKSGELDIYYSIPADFAENPVINLYTKSTDSGLFESYEPPIRALLATAVAAHIAPEDALVLTSQYRIDTTTFDASGDPTNLLGKAIIPLIILVAYYILICIFGNRMLMTVVEEKENRISEMILTTLPAKTLIYGKLIAMITLGLLQLLVLAIPVIAVLIINRENPLIADIFSTIVVDPLSILTNLVLLFVSYFLFAGLCTLVGSLVSTARDAGSYFGVVMITIVFPFFFFTNLINPTPDAITYILTYFPLTAPLALMIRNALGALPWYEFLLGLAVLTVFTYFIVRLAIKSFVANAINFSKFNFKSLLKPRTSWKS